MKTIKTTIKATIKNQIKKISAGAYPTDEFDRCVGYFHKVTVPDILKESTDNAGADK